MKNLFCNKAQYFLPLLIILLFPSCQVQLVSQYDQSSVDSIIESYKVIDNFYNSLSSYPEDQRSYYKFANEYKSIESQLRILYLKNSVRPLNSESTQMTQNVINLFEKYRDMHKKTNEYKNAKITIHRNRFFQMFKAMLTAEKYKPQNSDDN